MPEINERVSVLEVEFSNMKESLNKLSTALDKNSEVTFEIKERLDKQNGLIPHMAESVKAMSDRQEEMMDRLNEEAVHAASTKVKMKILWAIAGTVGAALLGYLLKGIIG